MRHFFCSAHTLFTFWVIITTVIRGPNLDGCIPKLVCFILSTIYVLMTWQDLSFHIFLILVHEAEIQQTLPSQFLCWLQYGSVSQWEDILFWHRCYTFAAAFNCLGMWPTTVTASLDAHVLDLYYKNLNYKIAIQKLR